MNSRERVLRAVNFLPTDRVPIDLGAMKASGISVKAYNRVKERLNIHSMTRVWDPMSMIASVEEEVMRRFHVDVVPLDVSSVTHDILPERELVPMTLYEGAEGLFPPDINIATDSEGRWVLLDHDGKPTSFRMPREGYYFDDLSFNRPGSVIDPKAFRPINGFTDEQLNAIHARGKLLHDNTEYAILGWGGGVCFLGLSSLIKDRFSNVAMGVPSEWVIMLMTEKETCHEMMDKSVEASIMCLKQLHHAVGDYCFAWGIAADDSGMQSGEFISPELWEEMIKPHYTKLCDWIHRNTKWKTFLHSCGSIYNLIPHMIDAGIDILNPIQISAANMDTARLKKEYGGKIVFWGGGCNTQQVLQTASPEEVRDHVREQLRILKPGGGYVFNQVHNIQANVPTDNIIAMLDAAYEFG
jgi:uroporphyrinogen-III decarboxylase